MIIVAARIVVLLRLLISDATAIGTVEAKPVLKVVHGQYFIAIIKPIRSVEILNCSKDGGNAQ